MTVQVLYKNNNSQKSQANLVLFTDENFNINSIKKHTSNEEFSYIVDLLKTSDLKKDLLFFEINSKYLFFSIIINQYNIHCLDY